MSLTENLRRVLSAAVSEPGRNERELQRQSYEERDELAARRKQHACDHHESLWGRCAACGMTWEQQAEAGF